MQFQFILVWLARAAARFISAATPEVPRTNRKASSVCLGAFGWWLCRAGLVAVAWCTSSAPARADLGQLVLLLDNDQNAATGCVVATADGAFRGAELRVTISADLSSKQVTGVSLASCAPQAGTFGSEVLLASPIRPPWAVAVGSGTLGADLFEGYVPLDRLPSTGAVRMGVLLNNGVDSDALIVSSGQPILVPLAVANVPGLQGWGLLLLAAGLLAIGALRRRRRAALVLATLLTLTLPALSDAASGDGVLQTWGNQLPLAADRSGDGGTNLDIRALFARSDAARGVLFVRVDAVALNAPQKSQGCGVAGMPTGELMRSALDGLGRSRSYQIQVPADYQPSTPLSLVFVFHGAADSELGAKAFGLQGATGAAASSIFVFPRGVPWKNGVIGWETSCAGYDMKLFDNMLQALATDYCLDLRRVFAAGFSWGGDFVTALGCCRGDNLSAVAPASCTDDFANPADFRSYNNLACPAARKPAIRFTHASDGDVGYPAPLFATTSALFRSFQGCSDSSAPAGAAPCRSFVGCARQVVECSYPGLGHHLPATWAADTWSFFSGVP